MSKTIVDIFNAIASDYESRTAGACDDLFDYMLKASPPISNASLLIDNACGPGGLLEPLQRHLSSYPTKDVKARVICTDVSPAMIEIVQRKVDQAHLHGSWPNIESVTTHIANSEDLIDEKVITANTVTHAYTNLSLDFFGDPTKACKDIYESLAPGGVAFFTTRAEEDRIPTVRQTEKTLNPGNENFQTYYNDKFEDPEYLKRLLVDGGFHPDKVNVASTDCFMKAASVKEMSLIVTDTFTGYFRPNGWPSEEEKNKWMELFGENMVKDHHFVDWGEKGVGLRSSMLVVSGTK